ncbi:MAG TPA: polysaccharide biosynthesis/export family protein, partial [Phycisphaerales bacterium]|nr:polysaccharide biosynthesis/export family protein [Phycisphaerales bacterium]
MSHPSPKNVVITPKRAGLVLMLAAAAGGLTGCETDSYFNPSQVGRMETTPTIVPILDRLNVVEGGDAANPNTFSQPTTEDLLMEPESYRMGPGDGILIKIQDFFEIGQPEEFERILDDRGFIELPKLGQVFVAGQTGDEASQTIARAIRNKRLLTEPIVDANAVQRRKQTYNIMGGVLNPGSYNVPRPDFRLLEALANGGRFSENVQWVYVIRTVALTTPAGQPAPAATPGADGNPAAPAPVTPPRSDSVIDLIDSLDTPPGAKPGTDAPPAAPSAPEPAPAPAPTPEPARQVPAIDIDTARPVNAAPAAPQVPASEWQFVNGQWVKGPAGRATTTDPAAGVLTQRVIQIPMQALLNGAPQYNIVVRPGDTIRVQSLAEGIVYVHGNVNRPGVYNLPQTGRMTIIRAIAAASDLNDI